MARNIRREQIFLNNVEIEAVAAEGNGLGHVDGKVIFVPKCVPGDVVDVQLVRKRKGFLQGEVVRLVKPSPVRQAPFCPHYGICGGCTWQALPYPKQLEFKQQQVYDQLTRIGHLTLPSLSPIVGSEKTRFYRNKLEYTFSDKRWIVKEEMDRQFSDVEKLALGFHIPQMFSKVLDIKECALQREPSNAIRLFVKQYAIDNGLSFFDIEGHSGLLRNLIIRTSSNGEVMVILVAGACEREEYKLNPTGSSKHRFHNYLSPEDRDAVEHLLTSLTQRFPEITSLYYVANDKGNDTIADCTLVHFAGKKYITEEMEGLRFHIGPKSFYQTNSEQAYKLYSVVRDFAAPGREQILYDLYTGTGTIALFLARRVKKVIGVEYVAEAIEDARINARENGIDNAVFYAGDMKDVLNEEFIAENGRPDTIILDPPRAGIHPSVAQVLLAAAAPRIVYVSCNPASQARDLALLSQKYNIIRVQPVDMFPHTQHVENVVLLQRAES